MFSSKYQGGPYFTLLSLKGGNSTKLWGEKGTIIKRYDKILKGSCLDLNRNSTLSLPKDKNLKCGLTQPFLLIQLFFPIGSILRFELTLGHLTNNQQYRLFFSTSFKNFEITSLHSKIPLQTTCIIPGRWNSLIIDLSAFSQALTHETFHTLETISITGNCKIRLITTLRDSPEQSADILSTAPFSFRQGVDCEWSYLRPTNEVSNLLSTPQNKRDEMKQEKKSSDVGSYRSSRYPTTHPSSASVSSRKNSYLSSDDRVSSRDSTRSAPVSRSLSRMQSRNNNNSARLTSLNRPIKAGKMQRKLENVEKDDNERDLFVFGKQASFQKSGENENKISTPLLSHKNPNLFTNVDNKKERENENMIYQRPPTPTRSIAPKVDENNKKRVTTPRYQDHFDQLGTERPETASKMKVSLNNYSLSSQHLSQSDINNNVISPGLKSGHRIITGSQSNFADFAINNLRENTITLTGFQTAHNTATSHNPHNVSHYSADSDFAKPPIDPLSNFLNSDFQNKPSETETEPKILSLKRQSALDSDSDNDINDEMIIDKFDDIQDNFGYSKNKKGVDVENMSLDNIGAWNNDSNSDFFENLPQKQFSPKKEVELLFDPTSRRYFDPKTGQYYETV
eukprot:TRINITY_DN3279_c4_g1_i1.p1 TRINITY_DN3279_c4_g1~~TRINITY_DN3279_c4_g1_i1.p1  ORF type:complete len:623 (-),score=157.12 TRINITY_DN3279_c4_g1_i1:66-1934(-)